MSVINEYLIGESDINTENVIPKKYLGLQFYGQGILDNICVRNCIKTESENIIISKPNWTSDVIFLTVFNNTTNSSNVFGLLEPQTKWDLSRQEVGGTTVKKIAILPPNFNSFIDYTIENKTYNYLISAQNDTQLSNPLIIEGVKANFYGVYLLDAIAIDNGTDNNNIECYMFDFNTTVDKISNNATITSYNNYTKYNNYSIGDTDFLTGSVTSMLAYWDKNGELQWSANYLDKFRKFINNKKEKILKFKNGKAIRCVTFNSDNESFGYSFEEGVSSNGLVQPITVTFGFRETGEV